MERNKLEEEKYARKSSIFTIVQPRSIKQFNTDERVLLNNNQNLLFPDLTIPFYKIPPLDQ